MKTHIPTGTEGYAAEAAGLLVQYETFSFATVHASQFHLFPAPPGDALDIGAGTGRDAAGLADLGYRVVAVEPTAELRIPASRLHFSPRIIWIDDHLPELRLIGAMGRSFDLVMLTAVWMHLDVQQRAAAMPVVARLVRPGGCLSLSLRHGPVPSGRRMFEVTSHETAALADASGLKCIQQELSVASLQGQPGVTWDRLAFEKR